MRIDPEFQALIPPLSDDEYAALELSIMAEGCRDAIVVWQHDGDDIIVDGHNRYAICTAAGLPYKTVTRDFSSRNDVKLWMIDNQLARRNLTPFKRGELALQRDGVLIEQGKANMSAGGKGGLQKEGLANLPNLPQPINRRDEIARVAEMSSRNVHKVKEVLSDAPAPIVDKARAGDISIHAAQRITKALQGLPDDVVKVALRLADDSADKVEILHSLHKSNGRDGSNQTFDEITRNGGFHYGDEMDEWCDFASSSVSDIRRALASVAKYHAVIESDVKQKQGGVPPALQSSESNEWYTPAQYLEAVRAVMGAIDTDPASNPEANQIVQAAKYYDIVTDGFNRDWRGRVFLNPPYGRDAELSISNQQKWAHRLIEQYNAGITTEAILLVNAVTDRAWFRPLWDYAICFTNHRIPFYRPGGEPGAQPVMGSVLVYFGHQQNKFANVFKQFGPVVLNSIR